MDRRGRRKRGGNKTERKGEWEGWIRGNGEKEGKERGEERVDKGVNIKV